MAGAPPIERLLRRDRRITGAALAVLCAAAWAYVVTGAGLGTAAWRMTAFELPRQAMAPAMPAMGDLAADPALAARPALAVVMWWTMMIAMMAPAAAPMVLLYARAARAGAGRALAH